MRKIILVAAMVLVSASAQAGDRSLSLSTVTAAPQATTTTQISEVAPAVEAPKYVDRPPAIPAAEPAVAPAPAATTTTASAPVTTSNPAPKAKTTAKAEKPRHKRWTEGRIIAELHRHGIYW
ncbi:hypothetical protein QA645_01720 [Bradyrhizobium sp. CIAT3101]|uniref:hypothetical protein n=1 Tax=Bradyrhizobium sp. CIAT3101 TaxID=439387 RepID=UPI0024B1B64D|nr:hypothetical protein [Bradyrhizobium sp. CIAT3101]WFU81489.1 hypothetical protein QA645_01720 [Bradyrhizobium sp. CIAT3101]